MADHKRKHANELSSAQKENHPPKKVKRKVSIAGLYDQQTRKRLNSDGRPSFALKHTAVSKQTYPKNFFAQFGKSKKAEQHPIYRDFKEATQVYKEGVSTTNSAQLEPVCNELLARVDGLSVDGHPLQTDESLSKADIENIIDEEAKFAQPFEDEKVIVHCRDRRGKSYERQVKVGDTIRKFGRLVEQKRAELDGLLEELREVDDQIVAAREDIIQTEKVEGGKLRRQLHSDLDALAKAAKEAKEQTVEHVAQARKAERAAADGEKRKLQELFGSLS